MQSVVPPWPSSTGTAFLPTAMSTAWDPLFNQDFHSYFTHCRSSPTPGTFRTFIHLVPFLFANYRGREQSKSLSYWSRNARRCQEGVHGGGGVEEERERERMKQWSASPLPCPLPQHATLKTFPSKATLSSQQASSDLNMCCSSAHRNSSLKYG